MPITTIAPPNVQFNPSDNGGDYLPKLNDLAAAIDLAMSQYNLQVGAQELATVEAGKAKASATNAASSASAANSSKNAAASSKTAAANSAIAAASSASAANSSKNAAASSKAAAANSATAAENSASATSSSKSAAATSATNAANSASAANTAKVAAEQAKSDTEQLKSEVTEMVGGTAPDSSKLGNIAADQYLRRDYAPIGISQLDPFFHMRVGTEVEFLKGVGMAHYSSPAGYVVDHYGKLVKKGLNEWKVDRRGLAMRSVVTNLSTDSKKTISWRYNSITMSLDGTLGPDGVSKATRLVPSSSNSIKSIHGGISITAGKPYTWTYLLKADELGVIQIGSSITFTPEGYQLAVVDLRSGVILAGSQYIKQFEQLADGWWLLSHTHIATKTAVGAPTFQVFSNNGQQTWSNNGTDGFYVFCRQCEQSSFFGGFVDTTGSPATRSQDNLYIDSKNLPAPPYSILMRCSLSGRTNDYPRLFQSVGESKGECRIQLEKGKLELSAFEGGNYGIRTATDIKFDEEFSVLFRVDTNKKTIFYNGIKGWNNNSNPDEFTYDGALAIFNMSKEGSSSRIAHGYIKELAIFDFAPSDIQATALTGRP